MVQSLFVFAPFLINVDNYHTEIIATSFHQQKVPELNG